MPCMYHAMTWYIFTLMAQSMGAITLFFFSACNTMIILAMLTKVSCLTCYVQTLSFAAVCYMQTLSTTACWMAA